LSAERPGLGIASSLTAVLFFAVMDATAKWLGARYPPIEIVSFRYLFGLVPAVLLIWYGGGLPALKMRRPLLHGLRAGLLFASLLSFFTGLRALPLAEAIAYLFTAPLFVALLSGPLIGEAVGSRRWLAVVTGFVGVLIMVRPGGGAFRPEALWALAAALAIALAMLLTRRMVRTETNVSIFFYTNVGAGIASLPFLALDWHRPEAADLWLFALVGVLGGTAAYLMVVAYRQAPAALVAPFEYTALVWGAILGWLLWGEQPGPTVWIGAAVIVLAGFYLTRWEVLPTRSG